MKVTVHRFTVADSFNFSQFNSSSMSLGWDCASKAPFGRLIWLFTKMMLSLASLTNEIVKPLIIVKAAFVLVSLLPKWKLKADSSLELGSLTKQTTLLHRLLLTRGMASTTPRYDGDCMKLSYAWFSPIIHDMKARIQLGVGGWWFFSWRRDLFVKYAFANNKEITVKALLPWWPPIVDWDRKAGSPQYVTDCVVGDETCIEVDCGGTLKLENCYWATDGVCCWDWLHDCNR